MKGYDKLDPKENKGQCQKSSLLLKSSFKEFLKERDIYIVKRSRYMNQSVTWSIVIMVAILLVAVTIVIYYIMRYDYLFPND